MIDNDNIEVELLDELYQHRKIVCDPKQTPIRIDKFLMDRLENVSRNRVQNAIKVNSILVNASPIKSNYKVRPHDEISIVLPSDANEDFTLLPENIPLNVVFEDDHVLVIDKEPGMVVHPGVGNNSGTLVNALLYHLQNPDMPLLPGNRIDRPGLVHRIDKDTSGLLVVAKSDYAMTHLAKQFFEHTINREYVALVWGNVEATEGTIEAHIGRSMKDRLQMAAYPEGDQGKHAITHYELLENLYYVSLVKCVLETGRTHQIRVHMKHIGHPLFNDAKYGGDRIIKGTIHLKYKQFVDNCFSIMPRQALHAKSLGFVHPVSGKSVHFESPLPDDFENVLTKWRNYTNSRKEIPSE